MLFVAQVEDLFTGGRSSREGYTEISAAQFATLSRVELPVTKNSWKIFSKVFFQVFWRLDQATFSRLASVAKIACFAQNWSIFRTFQFSLKLIVSLSKKPPFLHHFNSKSSRKRYGFSLSHFISHDYGFVSLFCELFLLFE